MPVERLDAREHLAAAADRDENLRVRAHGGLEDRQGTCRELVLLERGNFILTVLQGAGVRMCVLLCFLLGGLKRGRRENERQLVTRLSEKLLDLCVGHGCGCDGCDFVTEGWTVLVVLRGAWFIVRRRVGWISRIDWVCGVS